MVNVIINSWQCSLPSCNPDIRYLVASFPGLPCFCSSVCVQYSTRRKWKSGEKLERPGNVCSLRSCQSRHSVFVLLFIPISSLFAGTFRMTVCYHDNTIRTWACNAYVYGVFFCLFIYLFIWGETSLSEPILAIGLSVYNKLWVSFPDPRYSKCMHRTGNETRSLNVKANSELKWINKL